MGLLLWPFHFCFLFHEVSYLLDTIMAFISKVTMKALSLFLVTLSITSRRQLTQNCSINGIKAHNYDTFWYLFEHRKLTGASGQNWSGIYDHSPIYLPKKGLCIMPMALIQTKAPLFPVNRYQLFCCCNCRLIKSVDCKTITSIPAPSFKS